MKKISLIYLSFIIIVFSLFPSCGNKTEGPSESGINIYYNQLSSGAEWKNGTVYVEEFTFTAKDNPDNPNSREHEHTGYRIMIRDNNTGTVKCACVDPLCTHEIGSECPMVSENAPGYLVVVGNSLYLNKHVKTTRHNELIVYDLVTGELRTVFSDDGYKGSLSFDVGDEYVWYIVPDIVDKKTVYLLKRYTVKSGDCKTIASFEDDIMIYLCTDTRIYLGKNYVINPDPDKLDVFSVDYEGKHRREEPSFLMTVQIAHDTFLVSMLYKAGQLMMQTPHFVCYDIITRTRYDIPADGCALCIGYNETDGRLYYISSEKAEAVFVPLIAYKRAEELGISYEELMKDETEVKKLNDEIRDAYCRDKMYLKSCRLDGSDAVTHFEYPEGTLFERHENYYFGEGGRIRYDTAYVTDNRTGCVSRDGKWFYVKAVTLDEDGHRCEREARISLETGEVEYP